MPPPTVTADEFTRAVAVLRATRPRREITVTELAAPRRLAPYAFALGASVRRSDAPAPAEPEEVATGRLVLLYDPAGHPAWQGTMRMVGYVTTEVETDLATDTLLPEVGWSWLVDALGSHQAGYAALGGTVTQTRSTPFGELAGPPPTEDLEIRASWTPEGDLEPHAAAWCAVLASAAGLPPPGVRKLHRD